MDLFAVSHTSGVLHYTHLARSAAAEHIGVWHQPLGEAAAAAAEGAGGRAHGAVARFV